jgi:ADP-ribose pyrophosphatase
LEVIGTSKLTDVNHLNLFALEYLDRNGTPRIWHMATRQPSPKCISRTFEPPDAVVIVAVHEAQQKLVLIREYRVPLGDFQYGFPAGLVDPGESLEAAAVRELKEETGLTATDILRVSPAVYSSPGVTDESVAMVYARCQGTPSNGGNEASEDIQVILIGPGDAQALCGQATVKFDAKAWLILSAYAASGRL